MNYISLDFGGHILLACYLVLSCRSDLTKGIIANKISYSFLLIALGRGLVESLADQWMMSGLLTSHSVKAMIVSSLLSPVFVQAILGALICFGLTVLCWRYGNMGGADVKMATVIGAYMGPYLGLMVIAACHTLALVFVAFALAWHYRSAIQLGLVPSRQQLQPYLQRRIPMAGFYAIAVISVLFAGVIL